MNGRAVVVGLVVAMVLGMPVGFAEISGFNVSDPVVVTSSPLPDSADGTIAGLGDQRAICTLSSGTVFVHVSENGGISWATHEAATDGSNSEKCVVKYRAQDKLVIAYRCCPGTGSELVVGRSVDHGSSWTFDERTTGATNQRIRNIEIVDQDTWYVLHANNSVNGILTDKTTDGGATYDRRFNARTLSELDGLSRLSDGELRVFIDDNNIRPLISTDQGRTWSGTGNIAGDGQDVHGAWEPEGSLGATCFVDDSTGSDVLEYWTTTDGSAASSFNESLRQTDYTQGTEFNGQFIRCRTEGLTNGTFAMLYTSESGGLGGGVAGMNLVVTQDSFATFENETIAPSFSNQEKGNPMLAKVVDDSGTRFVMAWLNETTGGADQFHVEYAQTGLVEEAFVAPGPDPVDLAQGLKNFAAGLGFVSQDSQFFFALILVGLTTVSMAAALKFLGPSDTKNMVVLGAAALIGVFSVVVQLFELWQLLLALVLGAALVRAETVGQTAFKAVKGDVDALRGEGEMMMDEEIGVMEEEEDGGGLRPVGMPKREELSGEFQQRVEEFGIELVERIPGAPKPPRL